jgi:hypothetical protein
MVVARNAKRFHAPFNYIQNTTVRTGLAEVDSFVFEPEDYDYRWQHVKELVTEITHRYDWPPVKNGLCKWCPYFMDGCSIAPDADELAD